MSFIEYELNVFRVTFLQLSLQIPTAMLIFAKGVQLAPIMLQRKIGEARQLVRVSVTASACSNAFGLTFCQSIVTVRRISTVGGGGVEVLELAVNLDGVSHVCLDSIAVERRWERSHRSRSNRIMVYGGSRKLWSKWRSTSLQGRLLIQGVLRLGLIMLRGVLLLSANGIGWNPAQIGVVLLETLGMRLRGRNCRVESVALDSGNVVRRVRRLKRSWTT
jgi:hypothetical protein